LGLGLLGGPELVEGKVGVDLTQTREWGQVRERAADLFFILRCQLSHTSLGVLEGGVECDLGASSVHIIRGCLLLSRELFDL
jgi:hypothetical protein